MAETIKKFLDYEGLKTYNTNIKKYAQDQASGVETTIRGEFKVKNIDKTDNGKVALTLSETGVLGVTVGANVVVDSNYSTVAANANNSAAAWGKFLKDSESVYPNNITPTLKDLATTSAVTSAISTAKSEASADAASKDTTLKNEITTAYGQADTTLKNTLIGAEGNESKADTIWGAKKYADEKAGTALTAAQGAQSTADTAKANAATAQDAAEAADAKAVAAQNTANTLRDTTIPNLENSLNKKILDNTILIGTTKAELLGTENTDGNTIYGVKKYAGDLASGLSERIDSIVTGGVAFKGVVNELPSSPKNGDLVIIGKEAGITVGNITYKKDYEYIYSEGAWYELGDSDKNAKAIAAVDSKVSANKSAIDAMDAAYKEADRNIRTEIETLSNAAVKSIAVTDNSTYVTVSASAKDVTGKVTLTVSDSIAATFDTIESVDGKISTAKSAVKTELIGKDNDGADANTIKGAKAHASSLVTALENSLVAITPDEINGLFAAK